MFYQGEVLVPELVPAHLIEIPEVDVFNRVLEVVGPDVVLDPLCEETPNYPIDSKEQVAEGIPKVICGAVQGDVLNRSLSEVKELGERLPTASLPSEIGSVSFSSNPVLVTSSETKIDEREEHADCEIQKPVFCGGAGGVIGIKGDGHCCFHLAGVIGLL